MSISIVTPSLNQCMFIPRMIDSLHEQRYSALEHIVFDAGSTDGSIDVWKEWQRKSDRFSPVRVFVEPDRGQSDAINKGMRVATGTIVGWLNSDDFLMPGALVKVAEAFERNPEAVVIYGVGAKTDLNGRVIKKVPFREFCPQRLSYAFEEVQPAMFFRRDAYWQVSGLDESLHYAMDWDLLLKLANVGKVVAIPDYLANIRYYPETKTNTGGWRRMREIARIARRHNGALDRNNLSFQTRDLLARQPMSCLRTLFDHICWNLFKDPPLMVQGWP